MKKMIWSVLAVLGLLTATSAAHGSPIVYTVSGNASGSLGATAFLNSLVTVSFTGDTSNVTGGGGFFSNSIGTATVTIAGVGTATFTDAMQAFVNQTFSPPAAGIAGPGGSLFDTFNAGFSTYNLATPISLSGSSFINPGLPFHTTSGDFVLTSAGNSTFTAGGAAAAVPEPATLIAFGVMALGGAGYVRRRKVAATARA